MCRHGFRRNGTRRVWSVERALPIVPSMSYYVPPGGLPGQSALLTDRAVFTESYAVIPKRCLSDITTSGMPHWRDTRFWVLARPMSGFAETFSQVIARIAPGGGSDRPETDPRAEGVLFVVGGTAQLTLGPEAHQLGEGSYVYIPAGCDWQIFSDTGCTFHWIRKAYEAVEGIAAPAPFVTRDQDVAPTPMPDCDGVWATTVFVDPQDMAHDMHVTIVTFQPGGVIPFLETHVMEHGLYVLEGKAAYRLNQDWVEVEAGDFMWLRAFCPQACYASGPGPFRYLLYKDVNRQMPLSAPVGLT